METQNLKENENRANLAVNVFWLLIILNAIAVISGYQEYQLLDKIIQGESVTDEEANANDIRQGIIGLLQTGVYIATIITFLNWFRRAYANLHRMGINYLEYDDRQAIWGFAIPVINLIRPFKIMKEIWIETQEQIKKLNPSYNIKLSTLVIGLWWGLFIISNYVSNFSIRTAFKYETAEQIQDSTMAYIITDLIDIPAALVTIIVIKQASGVERILMKEKSIRTGKM